MIPDKDSKNESPGPRVAIFCALYWLFVLVGVAALAYVSFVTGVSHGYQAAELSSLETLSQAADRISPPPGGKIIRLADGDVIGELSVPRLGVNVIVVQGDSQRDLRRAVGHIPGTSLPGQGGNVALAGHRDTFFRPLRDIREGDFITLKTPGGEYEYEVQSTSIVGPRHVDVLKPSQDNVLTLVTCFPFYYVGPAPNRFIVRARQITPPLVNAVVRSVNERN
jgi:sortase A